MLERIIRQGIIAPNIAALTSAAPTGWTGPTTNLVHRWPLASDSVDVVAALNGTDGSSVTYSSSTGPNGGGCVVIPDDANGYINLPSQSLPGTTLSGDFSIGFWVNGNPDYGDTFSGGSTFPRAIEAQDDTRQLTVFLEPVATIHARLIVATTTGGSIRATVVNPLLGGDVWTHCCVVVTGGSTAGAVIYLNGSAAVTEDPAQGVDSFYDAIGNRHDQARPAGSKMAQVVYYTKALSSGEVTTLYSAF